MTEPIRRLLITGGSGFIGTNYIEYLRANSPATIILNLDTKTPQIPSHVQYWQNCDLRDSKAINATISAFKPGQVVHLAGRTDVDGQTIEDYASNTLGTDNLLAAIEKSDSIHHVIITSSQFVKRPGLLPNGDEDYDPHTVYGESKVYTERKTQQANLKCTWTIVRPTNIWGPWHPRYPSEFWRIVDKGLYFHPSGEQPTRCYGYVSNVISQMEAIFVAKRNTVDKKVFYVGDPPIILTEWVDGFCLALTGRKARRIPFLALKVIAKFGDMMSRLGIRFPLTSSRLLSMTSDYLVPMEPTFEVLGSPPVSLKKGIDETVEWLENFNKSK